MSFLKTSNELGSAILKWLIIALVACGVVYLGMSIWGNVAEANAIPDEPPEISKAGTELYITATGERIYTDDYSLEVKDGNEVHLIDGYYELVKSKWQFRDIPLSLNEFYFGNIKVTRR